MMPETALPSCPFCGGRKYELMTEPVSPRCGSADRVDLVVCNNCGARAPVDAWRQRAATSEGPDTALSCRPMQFGPAELDTVRQWFDSVHDVTPTYLQQGDYELAKRIYEGLGWRVPESIKAGEAALGKLLARREEITRLIQSKYQGVSIVSIGEEDPAHVIFTFPGGEFRGRWIVGQDTVLLREDDHPAWEEFRRHHRMAKRDGGS